MNYVIEADINILTTTVSRLNAAVKKTKMDECNKNLLYSSTLPFSAYTHSCVMILLSLVALNTI